MLSLFCSQTFVIEDLPVAFCSKPLVQVVYAVLAAEGYYLGPYLAYVKLNRNVDTILYCKKDNFKFFKHHSMSPELGTVTDQLSFKQRDQKEVEFPVQVEYGSASFAQVRVLIELKSSIDVQLVTVWLFCNISKFKIRFFSSSVKSANFFTKT